VSGPASERGRIYTDEELLALPTVFRSGLFDGCRVLVSGAGTGIGRGIALLFGRLGARVVVCGRRPEPLEETRALLARAGCEALALPTNVREPEQVDALFAQVVGAWGGLDVLVNNAGGQFPQHAIDISDKGWRAVIDTNLNGTWTMMQRAARLWRERGGPGCIVSLLAPYLRGMYGVAHTVAARAGVAHLLRAVAVEWAPLGIRVNGVLPGSIATRGLEVYPREARAAMQRSNPLFTLGDVQDVAEACAYLAAPSGRFVTGEVLVVDGGQQLWGELWLAGRPAAFAAQGGRDSDG
jgi:NAD(P)-dependent dehydrogenase (short-subunit alcohol dehydrogenase family)